MADQVTVGAAIAAAIKAADLVAGRVFEAGKLGRYGERVTLPYVTWLDPVADTPALEGDCGVLAEARLVQVSLWQKMADESPGLYRALKAAIRGAALNAGDPVSEQHVYRCAVADAQRIDDPEPGIVQHAITVRVTCAV